MKEEKPIFAEVLLPLPLENTFTYRVNVDFRDVVKKGVRVVVQFGRNKIYSALVMQLHQKEPQKYKVKDILDVLDDKPVVTQKQLQMWDWVADYYMACKGEVMNVALPSALKLASESKIKLHPAYDGNISDLTPAEHKILENLVSRHVLSIDDVSKILGFPRVMPLVKNMIEKEIIILQEELSDRFKPRKESYIYLEEPYASSEEEIRSLLDSQSKKAYRQMEVLMLFFDKLKGDYSLGIPRKHLRGDDNKYASAIRALIDKGVMREQHKTVSRLESFVSRAQVSDIRLTGEQDKALEDIRKTFDDDKVALLHGVTSSGKTEIYIHLIEDQLKKDKQVLFLLPEIALTTQIIQRLTKYFGNDVTVYHSRFNQQERTETWRAVLEKRKKLIVGARSSLFLPFHDLGLVIVDEEHDSSFKQYNPAPRYQGRDVAVFLGKQSNANIILGSATPSLESSHNADLGKYEKIKLFRRYGDIQMPEIKVADLNAAAKKREMHSHFSKMLLDLIKQTLEKDLQVILFQNRRGFSLRVQCHQCGWMPECPNCDVGLIYHKYQKNLRCHYCGYRMKVPSECPSCGSTQIRMQGFGTEKIEEELPHFFPQSRIARMDLDSTRTKNAYRKIIGDFESRKLDILVGTQMVTKGLDFDHVGLVGVLNMDNMLGFPDFRAFERAFQLLAQVSGRAGRKGERGKVIVQSRQPYHAVIRYAMQNDYQAMYDSQIQERKKFKYPPFYRLIRLTLKHKDQQTVYRASNILGGALKAQLGKRVLGPEFPAVSRIRRLYLRDILIKVSKADHRSQVKSIITKEIKSLNKEAEFKSVQVLIDVDPV